LRPTSETAAFLLPGLIHQFGNLLLTVQGNALQLPGADEERRREAILGAVARGTGSLQVMRQLLGEHTANSAPARDLLQQLAELGRVPVRERGFALELRGAPGQVEAWVLADAFVGALCEALRRWVDAIPPGASGVVTLQLEGSATGGCDVLLGLELSPGSLPFPLAAAELAESLASADDAQTAPRFVASEDQRLLRLSFPPLSVSPDRQA